MASLAGPEANLKALAYGPDKGAVLPLRLSRRASDPAEDAGSADTHKRLPIEPVVTLEKRRVERVMIGKVKEHLRETSSLHLMGLL